MTITTLNPQHQQQNHRQLPPTFLVLCGDGINCEQETARAVEASGGKSCIKHINDLLARPALLQEVQALILPGGFSFGDELGSGQVLAFKLKCHIEEALCEFVAQHKPILGICNGFQVLVRLGFLPNPAQERTLTLTTNRHGHFHNRWVRLACSQESHCLWTKNLFQNSYPHSHPLPSPDGYSYGHLPIRNKEGRLVMQGGQDLAGEYLRELEQAGQVVLKYADTNYQHSGVVAGLCDPTGTILGLMPHPELCPWPQLSPKHVQQQVNLFKNAVTYLQ